MHAGSAIPGVILLLIMAVSHLERAYVIIIVATVGTSYGVITFLHLLVFPQLTTSFIILSCSFEINLQYSLSSFQTTIQAREEGIVRVKLKRLLDYNSSTYPADKHIFNEFSAIIDGHSIQSKLTVRMTSHSIHHMARTIHLT